MGECIDTKLKGSKIKLPLFPMSENGRANKQLIDVLLRSRLFRDYESVFTKATGLPLHSGPLNTGNPSITEKTREPILRFAGGAAGHFGRLFASA